MTTRGKWLDNYWHRNRTTLKLKSGPDPEPNDITRNFQICVNVLEGKKLMFVYPTQPTSYVVVALDKVKYRSGVRQNMRVPYYRENFVFELFTSVAEMRRKCLWFTVIEPFGGIPRMLGEAGVDLAHVWRQPHHTITHKWVQLTLPTDAKKDPVGFLKLDISISARADVVNAPFFQERIENNLLLLYESEQQPACYQVTIYRAYNVPCTSRTRPDILGTPPSTYVRLAFCDLMGETSPQLRTNNPVYIERISLVEMFPNVCDTIQLDVCSVNVGSKVLARTRLKLSQISHGGENGFLPTFGPSLLHMYGPWHESDDGPFHRGALLVTMKTIVPYYKHSLRTVHVEPVNAGSLDTEWIIENFIMFCPVFEVSMLNKSLSGTSCGIAITTGEIPFCSPFGQDSDEFETVMSDIKHKKLHYTGGRPVRWNNHVSGHLELTCPVLQLASRMPDLRLRMYMDNVLLGILADLENNVYEISTRLANNDYQDPNDLVECLHRSNDETAGKIRKFLEIVQYSSTNEDMLKYTTELDHKLVQLQKEKIEKIYCRLISRKSKDRHLPCCSRSLFLENIGSKKTVKMMLAEARSVLQELKELMYKVFKTCVFALGCLGLVVAIQPWLPRVLAKRSDVDLRNYIAGLDYGADYNPASLPDFTVDYANMIRNDIILLDKLSEVKTSKMGNNKVKKDPNTAMSNVPCNCERTVASDNYEDHFVNLSTELGMAQWYPQRVRNLTCDDTKCKSAYRCQRIVYNTPDGWPHISVWLLSNGSRVAHAKITPGDVIHSVTPEQSGRRCGKIQTVYIKPIKCPHHGPLGCHCIFGKVELFAWMGLFRHRAMFQQCIPDGYRSTESGLGLECEPVFVECCVNIYRAKLSGSSDLSGLSPFVRIHFMNNVKDTQVCQNTACPVWSEVLRISCIANVPHQRLETSPPEILVEVYHWDSTQKCKIDLLGRVTLTPEFLVTQDLESPPALDWFDLHLGAEDIGKIQMSAQLMQNHENVLNKASMNRTQELIQRSSDQVVRTVLTADVPEPLPRHILPANMSYKIDVYFWGLREVSITNKPLVTLELEDITIKSTIITQCKSNCNFPNARMSQTFQGNLANGSQLAIKLFDTTTFGRTLSVGSNVKKPEKYLLIWLPKSERDEKLFLKPVVNNLFMQVNRKTFVKRSLTYPVFENPKTYKNEEEKNTKKKWEKMRKLFCKKDCEEEIMLLPMYSKERDNVVKETEDDWWTRYYTSLNEKSSGDREVASNRITIYDSELEEQPDLAKFKDWCGTIKIYNSSKTGIPEKDEKLRCGYLKANIAIYQWPTPSPADTVAVSSSGVDLERGYFDNHPDNEPTRYLVRVYVVKCSGLVTQGITSRCNVAVQCNSKKLCDRQSSVPRDAEPAFGKMYELDCTLPEDYLLKISVLDCGATADELIGCTSIDLEDRAYTKYRATVGLASEYNIEVQKKVSAWLSSLTYGDIEDIMRVLKNGPNRWRDSDRPSAILEQLCEKNHLPAPEFPDPSSLVFNGVEYKDLDSGTKYTNPLASKENLCLNILHKWHTIPVCGHRLIPEHVEIRTLYDPDKPRVEQGKIHMWVDIFPLESRRTIPAPVSIRPRPDEHYELRVVVWDVQGLKLQKGANIYVRAWIGPSDEAQDTDIYTSTNGEGRFSWRMIFQFQYKHTERKLVFHDKGPFTEVTELFPPILVVQVLDIDAPSLQDFIGMLTLDLSGMPRGSRLPHSAHAVSNMRKVNMFAMRNARGWWPLRMVDRNSGNYYFAGIIELEISLMPQDKALLMPVGLGRDSPMPLPDPIHQPQVSRSKSDTSLIQCGPTTRLFVALGFILLGLCLFWQLPIIVVSSIPSMNI